MKMREAIHNNSPLHERKRELIFLFIFSKAFKAVYADNTRV